MLLPIIMAGGTGTRLWPLSRALYPKQFLNLVNDRSMLQETALRLDGLTSQAPVVICNEEHRFLVAQQIKEIDHRADVLLEPEGRNTAPAIALAAIHAQRNGDDPLLLILAADHVIQNVEAFHEAVKRAIPLAEAGQLVTFGIVPTTAETGYGYIQRGTPVSEHAYEVNKFVEKPDKETAEVYLNSGIYDWNSGMFMFRASRYLEELQAHRPDMVAACSAAMESVQHDLDFIRVNAAEFRRCPEDSIDYAVMENTKDAVVVPMDASWSDVGSWSALWDVNDKDLQGNSYKGDVILKDTSNCLVQGGERLIATVGLENLVVVDTKDAVLIADKSKVQDVKAIVNELKQSERCEFLHQREVYRPWGKYDSIDNGMRHQVKLITVKPGAKLSVQMHHHRAEHWIVVAGTAKVTNGEETFLVTENESTYIPIGAVHALENPGKINLELIEVQSGSYLGEDDIVRLEDRYGRN